MAWWELGGFALEMASVRQRVRVDESSGSTHGEHGANPALQVGFGKTGEFWCRRATSRVDATSCGPRRRSTIRTRLR